MSSPGIVHYLIDTICDSFPSTSGGWDSNPHNALGLNQFPAQFGSIRILVKGVRFDTHTAMLKAWVLPVMTANHHGYCPYLWHMFSTFQAVLILPSTVEETGFEPAVGFPTVRFQHTRLSRSRTLPESPFLLVTEYRAPVVTNSQPPHEVYTGIARVIYSTVEHLQPA